MKKWIVYLLCLLYPLSLYGNGKKEFTVLQWNIWQEGTVVEGGYEAIVNEIARLKPDFVTFSEVRTITRLVFVIGFSSLYPKRVKRIILFIAMIRDSLVSIR